MSVVGQSRHFDRTPMTSGLPRLTDIFGVRRHVSNVQLNRHGPLFDHLVGAEEQRERHVEAERLGSLEVDDHLDLRDLLDR